jgi:hypothetical protein
MKQPFDYQASVTELGRVQSEHQSWRAFNYIFLGALVCNLIALLFLPRAVWVLPVISSALVGSLLMARIHAKEARRLRASLEQFQILTGDPAMDEFTALEFVNDRKQIHLEALEVRGLAGFVPQLEGLGFVRRNGAYVQIRIAGARHVSRARGEVLA